jgi:probable rRNA maturation factor
MSELGLRQRQGARRVNVRLLRRLTFYLLGERWKLASFTLGLHLVGTQEMTALNERYLGHAGSTDVITFDYSESSQTPDLHGEIFICVGEAARNAARFHTTWPGELVRYLIHGLLHLRGFDDQSPGDRRRMKRQENRWLREVSERFGLDRLAVRPGLKLALRHGEDRHRQRSILGFERGGHRRGKTR